MIITVSFLTLWSTCCANATT